MRFFFEHKESTPRWLFKGSLASCLHGATHIMWFLNNQIPHMLEIEERGNPGVEPGWTTIGHHYGASLPRSSLWHQIVFLQECYPPYTKGWNQLEKDQITTTPYRNAHAIPPRGCGPFNHVIWMWYMAMEPVHGSKEIFTSVLETLSVGHHEVFSHMFLCNTTYCKDPFEEGDNLENRLVEDKLRETPQPLGYLFFGTLLAKLTTL